MKVDDNGILREETPQEVAEREQRELERIKNEIEDLKQYLADTDYIYPKCQETGEDVNVRYAEIVEKRKQARARIQELENK